jgi:NADPH:quinone reductase-like Zn-dependent oxidoreductase
MLEAIVQPSLEVEIIQSAVPTPGEGEILIKVICSGVNPKGIRLATVIPSCAHLARLEVRRIYQHAIEPRR